MKINRLDIRPDIPTETFLMCLRDTEEQRYVNYEISEELYDKLSKALKVDNIKPWEQLDKLGKEEE